MNCKHKILLVQTATITCVSCNQTWNFREESGEGDTYVQI